MKSRQVFGPLLFLVSNTPSVRCTAQNGLQAGLFVDEAADA